MSNATLLTQLVSYSPWDESEARYHAAFLDLLRTDAAFDRNSYEPGHITGSTWILAEDTGRIALIYHGRLERWLQPGGHVEPGETDGIGTALREAREELGLVLDPGRASLFDLDVHQIPATATQPSHFHYDLRYLCFTKQQPLISDSDAARAEWFTAVELEAMGLDAGMQRMFNKGQHR